MIGLQKQIRLVLKLRPMLAHRLALATARRVAPRRRRPTVKDGVVRLVLYPWWHLGWHGGWQLIVLP